jgi:hypothetical protein
MTDNVNMPKSPTLRMFAPEVWGSVDHFVNLHSETYKFSEIEKRAVSGVTNHFRKALTLYSLVVKLRPNLDIDRAELHEKGYTHALNGTEFSAVFEAAILELYSSVDCTAKVLFAVYAKKSQGFRDSTRALFQSFEKITGAFPARLKEIFREVSWYIQLRFLRDELTHRQTGSCILDQETGKVRYMHTGITKHGLPLIIEDIFEWFQAMVNHINTFLGAIFEYLSSTLNDTPIMQICGVIDSRMLMRFVNPTERITFNSGACGSAHWFELPENPTCPFVDACGAYQRKRAI